MDNCKRKGSLISSPTPLSLAVYNIDCDSDDTHKRISEYLIAEGAALNLHFMGKRIADLARSKCGGKKIAQLIEQKQ